MEAARNQALRELPSVESLAAALDGPRPLAVEAAREAIDAARRDILAGARTADPRPEAERMLGEMRRDGPRRVINATGVVLHTNLGRAPLAPEAVEAAAGAAGYSDLELDLASGERGSRHDHLEAALRAVSGAEAAIAVNNNAGAVLLALAAMAAGRDVVVGRDQLIEIGGSFRIPDILAQSGAVLTEVGTTNRTRASDYEAAINERTGALLRVHQSNFRSEGFTETPSVEELCELGRRHRVPVIDDLGSGALERIGDEPLVRRSVAAGAAVVCFSADKLLGGPQAGVLAGTTEAIGRCRVHPLARALRLDKLQIAALAATLRLHREGRGEEVPALAMLAAGEATLRARAELTAAAAGACARVGETESRPGGGTLPGTVLRGPACLVDPGPLGADGLLAALRSADPPVVGRIEADEVVLDPRTMSDDDARSAGRAVGRALG